MIRTPSIRPRTQATPVTRLAAPALWYKPTRVLLLGLLFAIPCAPASVAQTPQTLQHFDEGNEYYAAGEFQQAIAAYEQALESGYASAEIYYNLGNAHYRLDELASAMLYYKRAEKLAPKSRELQHSILLTHGRLLDRFSRLPEPFWITVSQRIYSRTRIRPLTLLGLLMYIAGIVLIAYRMWYRTENEWIRRINSALLIIGLPLLLGGLLTSYKTAQNQSAVVMVSKTSLLDEPLNDSELAGGASELQIHAGLVVRVVKTQDEWSEIVLPNGVSGWVSSETLQII